jgi:hypothetical protein
MRCPAGSSIGEKLARCEGYVVRSGRGEDLGKVSWVRYTTRADCPDVLVVRASRVFGVRIRLAEISTDHIDHVDPSARTVTLEWA